MRLSITMFIALSIVACAVPIDAVNKLGKFQMVSCETILLENKSKSVSIAASAEGYETSDGTIAILAKKSGQLQAIGLSIDKESGAQISLIKNGETKVQLGISSYGDGIITLYDRHGEQTIIGIPE